MIRGFCRSREALSNDYLIVKIGTIRLAPSDLRAASRLLGVLPAVREAVHGVAPPVLDDGL